MVLKKNKNKNIPDDRACPVPAGFARDAVADAPKPLWRRSEDAE